MQWLPNFIQSISIAHQSYNFPAIYNHWYSQLSNLLIFGFPLLAICFYSTWGWGCGLCLAKMKIMMLVMITLKSCSSPWLQLLPSEHSFPAVSGSAWVSQPLLCRGWPSSLTDLSWTLEILHLWSRRCGQNRIMALKMERGWHYLAAVLLTFWTIRYGHERGRNAKNEFVNIKCVQKLELK